MHHKALAWRRMQNKVDDYLVEECVELLLAQNAAMRATRKQMLPNWLTPESKLIVVQSVVAVLLAFSIIWGGMYLAEHFAGTGAIR